MLEVVPDNFIMKYCHFIIGPNCTVGKCSTWIWWTVFE